MNLRTITKLSIAAGLLSPACGLIVATSCGAQSQPTATLAAPIPTPAPAAVPAVKQTTPELEASGHRVDQAKLKLDQAKNQLAAAKAMLKAAEAEFRAARADKEALAARTTATQLADVSGLKDDGILPVQPTNAMTFGTNRLYPVTTTTPVTPSATSTVVETDTSKTRIQQTDFNSPAQDLTKASVEVTGTNLRPEETPASVP